MKRPNILFLYSDEHRADVAGYAGNGIIRTPTLDWLAKDGVVFDGAYCPSPICIPGRQAMMSGMYPKKCGCENFSDYLAPGFLTLPRHLSQHAYNTVAAGKTHDDGPDVLMGFLHRIGYDITMRPAFMKERSEADFAAYQRPMSELKWSPAKEIMRAGASSSPVDKMDEYALRGAQMAVESHFLHPYYDREQPQQPLLLYYGTLAPHYPYFCNEENFSYYLNRVPVYENEPVFPHPFLQRMQVTVGKDVSRREAQRATAAYYGMIDSMDGRFAQLIQTLRDAGQDLDDWIIIYSTDHGEMLGEHGVWEKQKFYEGSARVPLIIRWPKRFAPRRVSHNVNTLDLFATLCELCGLPTPEGLDSRSLVPLMDGDASAWDDETASQFHGKNLMIKRGALKYHYYAEDGSELLFDLARDPSERSEFANEAAYAEDMAYFRARRAHYLFD